MLQVEHTKHPPFPEGGTADAAPVQQRRRTVASRRDRRWLAVVAPVGALVLAALLLDAPPFRDGLATLTGRHDNASFNFPLRVEVARQWLAGRLPLWNPYQFAGFPLLGDITTAALYPSNLPFLLDPSATRYRALDQVATIHVVLPRSSCTSSRARSRSAAWRRRSRVWPTAATASSSSSPAAGSRHRTRPSGCR